MAYRPDESVEWIVQHYSATFIDTEYSAERLERDHKARGFREAGYHAYVTYPRPGKPSRLIEMRDLSESGRFEVGAQSKGENSRSIGICLEGGLTRDGGPNKGLDTRHPDQITLQIAWIDKQLERFGGDGTNKTNGPIVEGHRDMPGAATQCPGYDASAWWRGIVASRRSGALEGPAAPQPDLAPTVDTQAPRKDSWKSLFAALFGGRS